MDLDSEDSNSGDSDAADFDAENVLLPVKKSMKLTDVRALVVISNR